MSEKILEQMNTLILVMAYSVFGLSKLFSGAALAVVIMAGSLEFAKLVTA